MHLQLEEWPDMARGVSILANPDQYFISEQAEGQKNTTVPYFVSLRVSPNKIQWRTKYAQTISRSPSELNGSNDLSVALQSSSKLFRHELAVIMRLNGQETTCESRGSFALV